MYPLFRAALNANKLNKPLYNNHILRKFATDHHKTRIAQNGQKTKQMGFVKQVVTDYGNYPILAANIAAASMIFIFGLRKVFFHPDVSISEMNRLTNEVQNEGPNRMDDAGLFRKQTRMFGELLRLPSIAVMKISTGTDQNQKFHLNFLRENEIPLPLESTNYFNDGLFEESEPKAFAKNEHNQSNYHYQYKYDQ